MAFGFHRNSGRKPTSEAGATGHADLPELVVVAPRRGVFDLMRETDSDIVHRRWDEAPGDLVATGRAVARGFKGRPASDRYYGLQGGGFHPSRNAATQDDLRALQREIRAPGRHGLTVVRSKPGYDDPRRPNVAADDVWGVNSHALFGDGTEREVDFTKVSSADLGPALNKEAVQEGSQLNKAIRRAALSKSPVPVDIIGLGLGQIGGESPLAQQLGIGRFAVRVRGAVTADDKQWDLDGSVSAPPDIQDYKPDPKRGFLGNLATGAGRVGQWLGGGEDYGTYLIGSQDIKAKGRRWR